MFVEQELARLQQELTTIQQRLDTPPQQFTPVQQQKAKQPVQGITPRKRGDRIDPLNPPSVEVTDSTIRRWAGWAGMPTAEYVVYLQSIGWQKAGKGNAAQYLPPVPQIEAADR